MKLNIRKQINAGLLAGCLVAFSSPALADEVAQLAMMERYMNIMQEYHALIDTVYTTASSEQKSTILQVQKIQEIYKERGEMDDVIRVLTKVVNESNDAVVRNATTIMLADALNESGNSKRALEVLEASLERKLSGER